MRPLTALFAIAVPYLLWEFAIAVFEIRDWRFLARAAVYVVPVLTWLAALTNNPGTWPAIVFDAHRVAGLAVLAATMYAVFKDRRDDLLEPRRRYRVMFVGLIALQAAAVLCVELLYGSQPVPAALQLANVVAIAALTIGLSLPLLQLDADILWARGSTRPAAAGPLPDVERKLSARLDAAMAAGIFREPNLGIQALASELGTNEHRLRRLINQRRGYRNFSAFLNEARVREVQQQLERPELAATPVLTLALTAGFASIGPFNRAFRQATGLTPTAYRRRALESSSVDSAPN